jgi:hypothetical protein
VALQEIADHYNKTLVSKHGRDYVSCILSNTGLVSFRYRTNNAVIIQDFTFNEELCVLFPRHPYVRLYLALNIDVSKNVVIQDLCTSIHYTCTEDVCLYDQKDTKRLEKLVSDLKRAMKCGLTGCTMSGKSYIPILPVTISGGHINYSESSEDNSVKIHTIRLSAFAQMEIRAAIGGLVA